MRVICAPGKDQAATRAGRELSRLLWKHRASPILLFVSGGSALSMLDHVDDSKLPPRFALSLLDERITDDSSARNYDKLVRTAFYHRARNKGASILHIAQRPGQTPTAYARCVEEEICQWRAANPSGIFLLTAGIGSDGHTAGIFPSSDRDRFRRLFTCQRLFISYSAARKNTEYPLRATATATLLARMRGGVALATGEQKREAVARTLSPRGAVHKTPARLLRDIDPFALVTDISSPRTR